MRFELGEIREPVPEDFEFFKKFALSEDGWVEYSSIKSKLRELKTSTKSNELSRIKMLKVEAHLYDVSAECVYNCLHDADYRKIWDSAMKEGYRICYISPCCDIGYYQFKSPFRMKNRDFVTQRCWNEDGDTYFIMNHSVFHKKTPPVPGVVRGASYLTGYYIKSTGQNSCTFYFLSQSDPKGNITPSLINMTAKIFAPVIIKRLHKAAQLYDKWKANNKPDFKPWHNFQQLKQFPLLDPQDISLESDFDEGLIDERPTFDEAHTNSEHQAFLE